jgi:tryptophan-rich sensory protein
MTDASTWVKAFTQVGLATAACSVVGGLLTDPKSDWYEGLRKPWFQPPRITFPVVWTLLYATTALGAAGTITRLRDAGKTKEAEDFRRLHLLNLALNAGWSGAFFRSHSLQFATVWAGALAASSADLAKRAKAVNGTDAAPFLVYAAWCSFATLLSGTIARLNPKS